MKACSCGNHVAGNARFCPRCGKRFTHPFTMIFACVLGIGMLGAIIATASRPAEPPANFDPVGISMTGCELWTRANSKLAVDRVVNSYQIKARLPKNVYKVGLDYRTKGAGLMMHATCEYKDAGDHDHMVLVKAWSGVE